ncbi:FAD-dependent monooxygenase [Nonomuraea zeae]|uniref:FAD-dependent monooxygenase n=1 Tax=Nonomuraea zeae TaxID=1642303 RepID=A0A5S4GH19_9ACTN|nr:FAD-dependent monooxygenase [Nonomuraea zeae]TMR32243.1 FAD-dependent monooxygenase [Nonomuraea zeae]
MTYTALVAGGGIAGTTAAIALRKAGIDAVVHEAYDRTADNVGAFLTLAVNALDALRAIDLDLGEVGFDTPRITITSGSGRRLGELAYGTADGLVSRTVKRADLYRFLREQAAARDIPIEYGKRLVDAARPGGGGVRARFADGSTAEADLLIGADGLRSRTREIIDPAAPGARYTGLLNTGGYARAVPVGEPGMMHAVFGKRCFFSYTAHPGGEVWWAANPAQATELTPADVAAIPPAEWRARLGELFRRDRGPALDIIEATDEIFAGWNTYDVPSVPRWHRDRMIVIGDAAHATAPSIGQGAAMAIEDAVVLARCLRDGPGIEPAFAAYERLRRVRVERVVDQGNRTGGWKALSPVARVPRDVIMSLAMRHMARTGNDPSRWIYEHHIDWDEPVKAA